MCACVLKGRFVQNEFRRLLANNVPIPQLILWREVKMGSYKSALPPAAVVSAEAVSRDMRWCWVCDVMVREMPLYKERVPYVVVSGGPNVACGKWCEV